MNVGTLRYKQTSHIFRFSEVVINASDIKCTIYWAYTFAYTYMLIYDESFKYTSILKNINFVPYENFLINIPPQH